MTGSPPPRSWCELDRELDCWAAAGRAATLWWRDDDAVTATPALDRLVALADGVPLVLAVIPAAAEAALAAWHRRCGRRRDVAIVQHGWRHFNHAGAGKKSEFPRQRRAAEVAADLAAGRSRLGDLFGAAALPVLAPPWNRFEDAFVPLLAQAGIAALSRLGPRSGAGITQCNVDVDLVAWRDGRRFIGEERALAQLVGRLRARRCGGADPAEPTGILTHHLVQDAASEAFLERLIAVTRSHAGARWLAADAVFGAAAARAAA